MSLAASTPVRTRTSRPLRGYSVARRPRPRTRGKEICMPGVEGRVALVTGGAQGIGAAVARRLSQGGASVAVLDLQQEAAAGMAEQLMSAGASALGIGGDVSRRQDVQSAV